MSGKSVTIHVQATVEPFPVPDEVHIKGGGTPILLEHLAESDLHRLCERFKQEVFAKAGKPLRQKRSES